MCKWYEIKIEPRDVLFFRGAKPMQASTIGEGGQLPMPSVFHQAMLSAFHHHWPAAKTKHQHIRKNENQNSSFLYGDLKTVGVFPSDEKTTYFPMPADIQCADKEGKKLCMLQPGKPTGKSDLPVPLEKSLFKPDGAGATKEKPAQWISQEDLESYLKGHPETISNRTKPKLFDIESRPGIGIDPETGTAEDGKFYIAEYLRLRDGVSLKGFAAGESALSYFSENNKNEFIFGGQRGVAFLNAVRDDEKKLPQTDKPSGRRIKWVLLTPAVFTGGWLPSWIDAETGEVSLFEIPPGETKQNWRKRPKEERTRLAKKTSIGKLAASCIPKPVPYSGWKAQCGTTGPRPTRLCVPAGAVYYFETENEAQTEKLLEFLHGKRKSDISAEKGFGFGLCGIWEEYKNNENNKGDK